VSDHQPVPRKSRTGLLSPWGSPTRYKVGLQNPTGNIEYRGLQIYRRINRKSYPQPCDGVSTTANFLNCDHKLCGLTLSDRRVIFVGIATWQASNYFVQLMKIHRFSESELVTQADSVEVTGEAWTLTLVRHNVILM
jgi:hypothetical protein